VIAICLFGALQLLLIYQPPPSILHNLFYFAFLTFNMSSTFALALKGAILSMEATIPASGSDEATLQAWGMDFCKKLVRFSVLRLGKCFR
jgi:hypothetical protein